MEGKVLLDLPMVYAVGSVLIDGKRYGLAASEARGGKAFLLDTEENKTEEIWSGPGGTMATVGIRDREFLSIDGFYPIFDSSTAAVSSVKILGDAPHFTFQKEKLFDLPWCHRITFVHEEDGTFILAASLCKQKEYVEDWSTKGSVYSVSYDGTTLGTIENILPEVLLKHHALWTEKNEKGFDDVYVGGEEGVFHLFRREGAWKTEQILTTPTSDVSLSDLDGDGEKELAIIEGFHGSRLVVYRKNHGRYEEVDSYGPFSFGHVLWSGQNRILLGSRDGEKFLKVFTLDDGHLKEEESILGVSPAQVEVLGNTVLVAAHGCGKVMEFPLK